MVAVAWLIPLLTLLGPVFFLDRTFAFRDAAHYYAPLYRYVQEQWSTGLPLWNPLEENGRPLLADPTASVLYPGKLAFALPVRFETGYKLYMLVHLLLSVGGAYRAARAIGGGTLSSGMAALAYTFGGSVFFQYCNVIYLVVPPGFPGGSRHSLAC